MSQCSTFVGVWGPNWKRLHRLVRGAAFLEGDEARKEITEAPSPGLHNGTCRSSLQGDQGACQLTPPHDLIAVFARRWLREQVLTAWIGHRAQGQEGGKAARANRVVPTGLRHEVPPATVYCLWLLTLHLVSSSQVPPLPPRKQQIRGEETSSSRNISLSICTSFGFSLFQIVEWPWMGCCCFQAGRIC